MDSFLTDLHDSRFQLNILIDAQTELSNELKDYSRQNSLPGEKEKKGLGKSRMKIDILNVLIAYIRKLHQENQYPSVQENRDDSKAGADGDASSIRQPATTQQAPEHEYFKNLLPTLSSSAKRHAAPPPKPRSRSNSHTRGG